MAFWQSRMRDVNLKEKGSNLVHIEETLYTIGITYIIQRVLFSCESDIITIIKLLSCSNWNKTCSFTATVKSCKRLLKLRLQPETWLELCQPVVGAAALVRFHHHCQLNHLHPTSGANVRQFVRLLSRRGAQVYWPTIYYSWTTYGFQYSMRLKLEQEDIVGLYSKFSLINFYREWSLLQQFYW